jgi:hypothetical protein
MNIIYDRIVSKNNNKKYYIGSSCKKCGENKRYVSNHSCLNCSKINREKEKNKIYYQKWKNKKRNKEELDNIKEKQKKSRKKYYDNNKNVLKQKLNDKKQLLDSFYVKKALCQIKSKCKKNNIPFSISEKDIVIPEYCPVLGVKLVMNKGKFKDDSPSIDRIITDLGYVENNVIVVSWKVNRIKNNSNIIDLIKISDFYKKFKFKELEFS